jgi:hypothetical protein
VFDLVFALFANNIFVYFKFDSVCLIYAILFDNLVGFWVWEPSISGLQIIFDLL